MRILWLLLGALLVNIKLAESLGETTGADNLSEDQLKACQDCVAECQSNKRNLWYCIRKCSRRLGYSCPGPGPDPYPPPAAIDFQKKFQELSDRFRTQWDFRNIRPPVRPRPGPFRIKPIR